MEIQIIKSFKKMMYNLGKMAKAIVSALSRPEVYYVLQGDMQAHFSKRNKPPCFLMDSVLLKLWQKYFKNHNYYYHYIL